VLHRYYLGIDGGQSSTTALVADETGCVVGVGHGGPCNHVTGLEARSKFLKVVGECVGQAVQSLGCTSPLPHFAAACLGFSGGPEDKSAYARELITSPLIKVTHDAEIALTGATEGDPGIIIIAGTGSIAFGRNAEGRIARAGGWGYLFGDEGGAFDITRRALRAALRYEEGWGPATLLHKYLLEATNAPTANDLLHRFYTQPRHQIAAFATLVTDCAETGDAVAHGILIESAHLLTSYITGVYRNLFPAAESVPVAHVGGVFRSDPLRHALVEEIRTTLGCRAIYPRLSPAAGAVLEALRLDGNTSKLTGIPPTKS